MKFKNFYALGIVCLGLTTAGTFSYSPLEAAFTLQDGKLVNVEKAATMTAEEHFKAGIKALEARDWEAANQQFSIVTYNFPNTSFGQEGFYYLGNALYQLQEYDFANEAFSTYLKVKSNPKFFKQAIEYKFVIAERFRNGATRRFFGTKQLPKWASGKSMALDIYDEVIAAMPSNEIAARALYAKAGMLWEMKNYRESVEAYQMLIKRFPKNELTPESYVNITKVYLDQSRFEFQNPDILAFAQINLRRFKQSFPAEERLAEAERDVLLIKEVYARGLYDTGQFYERIQQPKASLLYYHNAISQFPDTSTAELCRERLGCLQKS